MLVEKGRGSTLALQYVDLIRGIAVEKLVEQAGELLKDKFGSDLKVLVLYGSYATGEQTEASDLNFIVVAEGLPGSAAERRARAREIRREFLWQTGVRISLVLLSGDDFRRELDENSPLGLGVAEGYRVLYGNPEYLAAFIDDLKERYYYDRRMRAWILSRH
jgi:predicted nucleotidyltransferase